MEEVRRAGCLVKRMVTAGCSGKKWIIPMKNKLQCWPEGSMVYIPKIRHVQSYSVLFDVWPFTRLAPMSAFLPSHCLQMTASHEGRHVESTSTAGATLAQVSKFVHMSLIDIPSLLPLSPHGIILRGQSRLLKNRGSTRSTSALCRSPALSAPKANTNQAVWAVLF